MNHKEIEKMEKYEKTYWWHVGRKYLVEDLIKKYSNNKSQKILEVGSGAGDTACMLQDYGEVYANDISPKAIEACGKRGIKNLILGDFTKLDNQKYKEKFNLVLALDVLEHIQDDLGAIQKMGDVLTKGGKLMITVPAYKFLWSSHDEALEHKRRYTSYEIKTKIKDSGFEIEKISHFVFFSFPIIALFKFLSNFISRNAYPKSSYILLPEKLNNLMIKILKLETKLLNYFYLPFGTTIIVVARKI